MAAVRMRSLDTILLPVDLASDSSRALDHAARFAELYGADVHVLHVLPIASFEPLRAVLRRRSERGEMQEIIHEHITERIENSALRRAGARYTVERVHRRAADEGAEIVRYASEVEADLIVMSTHGRRDLQHPALSGTTGHVLREAACPVLTVPLRARGKEAAVRPAPPIRRMLVPVDFSEHAERAVPVARRLSAQLQAALALLFVAEERTAVTFSDTGLPGFRALKTDPEITERATEALRQLYDQAQEEENGSTAEQARDVEATFHLRHGRPARQILRFAEEEDIGLILQSALGRGEPALFDLGSVAERVVRRAPCAVLTLKGPGGS